MWARVCLYIFYVCFLYFLNPLSTDNDYYTHYKKLANSFKLSLFYKNWTENYFKFYTYNSLNQTQQIKARDLSKLIPRQ